MLCKTPYQKGPDKFGCGQCRPCRINRARAWVARMQFEQLDHPASCFVTLTYAITPWHQCVDKEDLQNFLKRLRKALPGRRIRYYAVSEYGEKSFRPHYHLVIFGVSLTEESIIEKSWSLGFVKVGTAEPASMRYLTFYMQKKMTARLDPRLGGRTPEFACMSLKPGIGHGMIERITQSLSTTSGKAALRKLDSMAGAIRLDGKKVPITRYIKQGVLQKVVDRKCLGAYRWDKFLERFEKIRWKTRKEQNTEYFAQVDQEAGRFALQSYRSL